MGEIVQIAGNPGDTAPVEPTPATELIGGKFKDQDALLAAYKELEQKQSAAPAVTPAVTPAVAPVVAPAVAPAVMTHEALTPYYEEYAKNGNLSEVSVDQIGKLYGVPRETVLQHLAGAKALAENTIRAGYEAVGGEAPFQAITQWAQVNMPQDLALVQGHLNVGDERQYRLGLETLKARFEAANGREGVGVVGAGGITGSGVAAPFKSPAEMTAAMERVDEQGNNMYDMNINGYRDQVTARAAKSDFVQSVRR